MGGLQKWGTEKAGEARRRRDAQRPLYVIWTLSEDMGHAVRARTGLESRAAGEGSFRSLGKR